MIKYVFLDLDDTIFDFKKAEHDALIGTLCTFDVTPTEELCELYSRVNLSQWKLLEKKEKTREQILVDRFKIFFSEIGIDIEPMKARKTYEPLLSEKAYFIEGAQELLDALYEEYDLFLATNGTYSVQTKRIAKSGISKYFKGIFISEQIGFDKPSRDYFNACFKEIYGFDPNAAIIIGDSLSSDIKGASAVKIKSCLYNPKANEVKGEVIPDYEVKSLSEIPNLLKTI